MDWALRQEINSCISEINSIVRQLRYVSDDVADSISGMNTKKYTQSINNAADKYEKAAKKLRTIK